MLPAINVLKSYPGARLFLAPMSGITDSVFRLVMRELGAEVVISDLISAEGMVRGGQKTLDMLDFDEAERPVGIQIFGGNFDSLVTATKIVESKGADFVDLNLGCPVKKVVKTGAGSAWLRDPIALGRLLTAMKRAVTIPVTIKIRTGWDASNINAHEVIRVAYESGISWVAVHGRTRAQAYTGEADWELIKKLSVESPLPIIGNGDILTPQQANKRLEQGYCHGVMIGRGALKNPWIFRQILGEREEAARLDSLVDRHYELAIEKKGQQRAFLSLKKFFGWYASGLPGASQFRGQIFRTAEPAKLRELALEFFGKVSAADRYDDGKPFLMGGHG